MKNLTKIIAIAFLGIFTLTSCEDENIQEPAKLNSNNPTKSIKLDNDKDCCGEEEDPIIIYGVIVNEESSIISGAEVIIYQANSGTPIDTVNSSINGAFQFEELADFYFFEVSASGYQTLTSQNLEFPDENGVNLELAE